jgi:polyisoprenoid-binding protein YceI
MKYLMFLLFLSASLPVFAEDTLIIDQGHSAVVFNWNHRGFSNPVARFEKIEGRIVLDAGDMTKSSVSVRIPLAGLRTAIEILDRQLKGEEFFEAVKYPDITFKSTGIAKGPMETLKISGTLSVHGVSRPIVLDAKINRIESGSKQEPGRAGFEADAMLQRSDFGVGKYVPTVSDDIHVHITLEAFQKI